MHTMKIIALLPVKNEGWVLRHCLESLCFCDKIIAIDDNSSDDTRNILNEFKCEIIPLDTETNIGWKEYEIRTALLIEARKQNATHIIAIDGDEMLSDLFVLNAREIISSLRPGEVMSLPWINVVDENNILNPTIHKAFIMADDKVSIFKKGFIHIPRVPSDEVTKTLELPYAMIHFQQLHKKRNTYKKIWYMMSELLKKERGALRINTTYLITERYKPIGYNIRTILKTPLPNPNLDQVVWHEIKVLELLQEYGCIFFEKLDIWNQPELKNKFIKEVGHVPKPQKLPSLLILVNNVKNFFLPKVKSFIQKNERS